ncbi:MAG: carboxylate-amine ligase [Hyphomicrobiales bacterium]|nr:carboxylate-amine ligase [Hyphomicrobiales bacterium]MCP5372384.1 carboxylate-amine ligase [Hyphomicrobiales bacterium]
MTYTMPAFTIGIEEEYLLIDPISRDLAEDPPAEIMSDCERRIKDRVRPEFLKSQIEVGTGVCADIEAARADLRELRQTVIDVARKYDLGLIAASTHPFSEWQRQKHTDKERYHILAEDMQAVARRLLICGMHVHVGIEDDELRIDLMNQVTYFLPHLLALSTSSPFWRGTPTGLQSYRLSVFDELPRTGVPEAFDSYSEYARHVGVMVNAGLLKDASMLWWDVRPSCKFPTLEMRITDVCTRLNDTLSIAALYVSILRMLYRLRRNNQRWRKYATMLINENRWRAQRYGIEGGLVDFGRGEVVPVSELMEELIALVREDAQALGCLREVEHCRTILSRGTSAHRQLEVYKQHMDAGETPERALVAVVDNLMEETALDLA